MFEIFERLLKQRNEKYSDVSKATGIPYSTFTDWKAGRYTPKQDKLQKIADYFGVSFEYLTTGKDSRLENLNYYVSDFEYMLISAYREQDNGIKEAIHKLLGIEMEVKKDALDA